MTWYTLLFAKYVQALEWITIFVAIVILLSSLDDIFIDIYFWVREAYRALYVRRRYKPMALASLYSADEKPLAIMVPAWQEANVIEQMIENAVSTFEYSNFRIFCGTYPNDPDTRAVVDRIALRFRQLVHVHVPHDGPTCKADCLNWIIQAILSHEERHAIEFAGVVVHDSEDVVHPLELKLFNYLLPRKDLIQLPVMSLERRWNEWVAGVYVDDFAEWHSKDLVVRESFTRQVPCAGVGTCFSRRAFTALVAATENQPFNTETVAEDYEVSYRLSALGMSQVFVRVPVGYKTLRRRWLRRQTEEVEVESVIAVREYFPSDFMAACRQRTRWILGVVFQHWLAMAWPGGWRDRYMLIRDRKGVITSLVAVIAYLLVVNYLMVVLALKLMPSLTIYSSFIESHPWVQELLAINLFMLCNRVGQRFYFVSSFYGWEQGLLAIPRMVVANAVNFVAACRAWQVFLTHVTFDRRISWDKTDHVFPSALLLRDSRRRLGSLLVAWRAITTEQLNHALARQSDTGQVLGRVLVDEGWINEDMLADALSYQLDLPRGQFDVDKVNLYRDVLPAAFLVRNRALVMGLDRDGMLDVITSRPPDADFETSLQSLHPGPVRLSVVRDSDIAHGLRVISAAPGDVVSTRSAPLLGDILIERGRLRQQDIDAALENYSPDRDGRFGNFLVARELITEQELEDALAYQRAHTPRTMS
jgi:adsorption protein B